MASRIIPILALAVFVAACETSPGDGGEQGVDTGTGTNSTSDDNSTTNDDSEATHGPDIFGPCECFNGPLDCGPDLGPAIRDCPDGVTCTIEGLCPTPDMCGGMGECTAPLEYSGDIDCALAALRDRTPATIVVREQYFLGFAACGVYYGDTHSVWIVTEQGRVPGLGCTQSDTGGVSWQYTQSAVEDVAYFDGCAGLMDDSERYACVVAGLTDPVDLSDCSHQGG